MAININSLAAPGVRLAAAGAAALSLASPASAMDSWTWNFTQFYMNESVPLTPVLDPNSGTMVTLLAIIAFCQAFNLFVKLFGWFIHDNDD